MTLKTVNTEHMSDVELAAKRVAEDVRTLQADLKMCTTLARFNWVGEGRVGFSDLSVAVEMQIKDIADELWKLYEKLIEIEGAFMEADQAMGTDFASAASDAHAAFNG